MANKHNPPAFQFYKKDWLSSANVRVMTPAQRGCYVNLLAYSWPDGIPYENEHAREGLWALAGMPDAASWDAISGLVLAQFVEKDGCLKHPKLDEQFKDLSVYHRMQKEKAKKGADARWHGSGKGRALPADASSSSSSTSGASSSSYSEKIEPIRIRQDADASLSNQEDDKDNPNPTAERPDSDDELNPLSDENSLLLANIFQELTGVPYESSFEQFIQWRGTTSPARLALLMWWAFRVSKYWSKPESWTVLDAANFLRAHRTLEAQFLKWPSADKLIEKFPTTQSILDSLSPPAEEEGTTKEGGDELLVDEDNLGVEENPRQTSRDPVLNAVLLFIFEPETMNKDDLAARAEVLRAIADDPASPNAQAILQQLKSFYQNEELPEDLLAAYRS